MPKDKTEQEEQEILALRTKLMRWVKMVPVLLSLTGVGYLGVAQQGTASNEQLVAVVTQLNDKLIPRLQSLIDALREEVVSLRERVSVLETIIKMKYTAMHQLPPEVMEAIAGSSKRPSNLLLGKPRKLPLLKDPVQQLQESPPPAVLPPNGSVPAAAD